MHTILCFVPWSCVQLMTAVNPGSVYFVVIGLYKFIFYSVSVFCVVFKYSPTPSSPTGGAPRSPSPLTADQTQLWSAIDLLITSIRDHIQAHQSRQYAMQLLNLTLAYVNKLIENATETLKVVQQGEGLEVLGGFNLTGTVLKEALVKLMGYVKELWVYLKGCPKWIGAQAKDEAKSEGMKTV